MHLSMLSDTYLSDSVKDSGRAATSETGAVAHRNGVLRGLAVMGIAGLLLGLTAMSTTFHSAAADTRCGAAAWQAWARPQAAVWWETNDLLYRANLSARRPVSVGQTGTAVTLVALRQRFRSVCR